MPNQDIYTDSQIDKLGNSLIYLCNKLERATKTHLLKLVFIIEELSIQKYGIPFFDLRFHVWKLGPVSKDLYVELTDEPNLLQSFILRKSVGEQSFFSAKKEFSDDEFSDNDIKLLEQVAERFKYCTANELINFTHKKDTPWYNTAVRNGVLALLENGKINTTDIEINLSETIEDDPAKIEIYNSHKSFLLQSKSLKS